MAINDDADLDGNWAPGGADLDENVASANRKSVKRKRKVSVDDSDAVADSVPLSGGAQSTKSGKKIKKKKLKAAAEEPPKPESANRKRRKKRAAKLAAARAGARTLPPGGFAQWSAATLADAWEAESKCRKLSSLEAKEISPDVSWFAPCSPGTALARLPEVLGAKSMSDEERAITSSFITLRAFQKRKSKGIPSPKPSGASIVVLVCSAERCFELSGKLHDAWGVKPAVLASHGGGRKADQLARQAKVLEKGVSLAIATPGRAMRLADDGSLNFESCEAVVLDLACDQKGQSLLTLHSTRQDMFALLKKHFLKHLQTGRFRILMSESGVTTK